MEEKKKKNPTNPKRKETVEEEKHGFLFLRILFSSTFLTWRATTPESEKPGNPGRTPGPKPRARTRPALRQPSGRRRAPRPADGGGPARKLTCRAWAGTSASGSRSAAARVWERARPARASSRIVSPSPAAPSGGSWTGRPWWKWSASVWTLGISASWSCLPWGSGSGRVSGRIRGPMWMTGLFRVWCRGSRRAGAGRTRGWVISGVLWWEPRCHVRWPQRTKCRGMGGGMARDQSSSRSLKMWTSLFSLRLPLPSSRFDLRRIEMEFENFTSKCQDT